MSINSTPQSALARLQRINAKEGAPEEVIFTPRQDNNVYTSDPVSGNVLGTFAGDGGNYSAAPTTSERADYINLKTQLNNSRDVRYRLGGK